MHQGEYSRLQRTAATAGVALTAAGKYQRGDVAVWTKGEKQGKTARECRCAGCTHCGAHIDLAFKKTEKQGEKQGGKRRANAGARGARNAARRSTSPLTTRWT